MGVNFEDVINSIADGAQTFSNVYFPAKIAEQNQAAAQKFKLEEEERKEAKKLQAQQDADMADATAQINQLSLTNPSIIPYIERYRQQNQELGIHPSRLDKDQLEAFSDLAQRDVEAQAQEESGEVFGQSASGFFGQFGKELPEGLQGEGLNFTPFAEELGLSGADFATKGEKTAENVQRISSLGTVLENNFLNFKPDAGFSQVDSESIFPLAEGAFAGQVNPNQSPALDKAQVANEARALFQQGLNAKAEAKAIAERAGRNIAPKKTQAEKNTARSRVFLNENYPAFAPYLREGVDPHAVETRIHKLGDEYNDNIKAYSTKKATFDKQVAKLKAQIKNHEAQAKLAEGLGGGDLTRNMKESAQEMLALTQQSLRDYEMLEPVDYSKIPTEMYIFNSLKSEQYLDIPKITDPADIQQAGSVGAPEGATGPEVPSGFDPVTGRSDLDELAEAGFTKDNTPEEVNEFFGQELDAILGTYPQLFEGEGDFDKMPDPPPWDGNMKPSDYKLLFDAWVYGDSESLAAWRVTTRSQLWEKLKNDSPAGK